MEFKYELSTQGKEIQQTVNVDEILLLPEFQPRKNLDFGLIEQLKQVEHIPAIKLAYFPEKHGDKLVLFDGNHRWHSRNQLGETEIDAFIYKFDSDLEIFKEAAKSNLSHGKILSKEERINSIARIIKATSEPDFSPSKLAAELGGLDRREIKKIYCWVKIEPIIGETEAKALNITKADALHRLLDAGYTNEEFVDFYEKYKTMIFGELHSIINKTLRGESIEFQDLAISKIADDITLVEDLADLLSSDETLMGDFDEHTTEEINPLDDEEFFLEPADEVPTDLFKNLFVEVRNSYSKMATLKTTGKELKEQEKANLRTEIVKTRELLAELESML